MEGLFSMLLFAGLFFVMMRFGCGAHMMHGRHASHKHGSQSKNMQIHIDPVCGMEVDVEQGYGNIHDGNLYRFCSRDCLDTFESDTERYLKDQDHGEHHHEGGMS